MFEEYRKYKELVDDRILDFLPEIDGKSSTIKEAMEYSLLAKGKRLRPVLMLATVDFCGGDVKRALPYAIALEYIHTYSLIHDDLPSMDNDDLRRGIPTNHKVYGESIAILAGDGLLNAASEAMIRHMFMSFDDEAYLKSKVRAANSILKRSGVKGMVAGQVADIEAEGKTCSKEMLDYINANKTGTLIVAAVEAGIYLSDLNNEKMKDDLLEYAENVGIAFQIQDDLLDIYGNVEELGKNTGTDEKKSTYPSVYGVEEAKNRLKVLYENARKSMVDYYDNAEFFNNLLDYLIKRKQ